MGYTVAAHVAAGAKKADVGHVVLAARVKTAADLQANIAHRFIILVAFGGQPLAQFAGQPARTGNAQLAGIGAGAGGHIDDGLRAGLVQANFGQSHVQRRQINRVNPAQHHILFHGSAHGIAGKAAGHIGQPAQLRAGNIAQRQSDSDGDKALLPLLVHIR